VAIIAQIGVGVYVVRVKTPDGVTHDVGAYRLRRALAVARALAGWLSVEDSDDAASFRPPLVVRVRDDILADFPDAALGLADVEVAVPAEGPDAVNGYESEATYRPGSVEPELLATLRREFGAAAARDEADDDLQGTELEPRVLRYRMKFRDPRK
jgi:hypothetical protein